MSTTSRTPNRRRSARTALLATAVAIVASAGLAASAQATVVPINGTLTLDNGVASSNSSIPPTKSWFRQQTPPASPSWVSNPNSANTVDDTYTLLQNGSTGLVVDGSTYQTAASDIVSPSLFYGAGFDIWTDSAQPVVDLHFDNTVGTSSSRTVTGDITAWSVLWNGLTFNQGAETGGGTGRNHDLTGTYNENTGDITLTWSSKIYDPYNPPGQGFDDFTGYWHLEGNIQ